MKGKRVCKVVQDLLPNYIEKLTNEETNLFIEEHLKDCKECSQMLDNMKKETAFGGKKINKKEVNYIKKYNKKLRILLAILLIILAIFLIRTGRNAIIISDLANKAEEYVASDNYHKKTTSYEIDSLIILDYYQKGDKALMSYQIVKANDTVKMMIYKNGDKQNMYTEMQNKKIAQLNSNAMMTVSIYNYFGSGNVLPLLLGSVTSNIKSVECNGKECYLINNYFSDTMFGNVAYIDKETGLPIRMDSGESKNNETGEISSDIQNIYYEFDNVDDIIFIEPDINEYEIIDNISN